MQGKRIVSKGNRVLSEVMARLTGQEVLKHYKGITFRENRARLMLLRQFRDLVIEYFANSRLNMMEGVHVEKQEASEARDAINLIKQKVYKVIRLADVNPRAAATPALAGGGHDKNVDLILNLFNLGRNGIPSESAVDYIERAIDVYRSNRLDSFMRTVNPFFWMSVLFSCIARRSK